MTNSTSYSQVFVFGDQTNAFESDLRFLLHTKDNASLCAFFDKAHYALRAEIAQLPSSLRELFPRFTSILDLLQFLQSSGGNPALGLALLTLNHIGRFIKYYGEESRPYPEESKSYALGLCTGSFAAAAISTSRTISELIPAALEAFLVSFRTGLASMQARDDIDRISPRETLPIWSMIVGLNQQNATEALVSFFLQKANIPLASRAYISAVTTNNVTISGPPFILDELLRTPAFSNVKSTKVQVYAPFHASHIYDTTLVDTILARSDQTILEEYIPRIPLISCSSGQMVAGHNYGALLRHALHDVLVEQLRWDLVLESCGQEFVETAPARSQFEILPILTNSASNFASALSQATSSPVPVNMEIALSPNDRSQAPTGRLEQSKIAIVGYSGRFPDSASTEKFWELLHAGLDVHREIPKDRFEMQAHFDPTGKAKNTSRIQHGCFIKEPGLFDSRFFNMSPRESSQADPGQRLAITTAYEAMEMAGFVPDRTPSSQRDRIGIFYGMTSDDWREVNSGQNIDTYFIPGGNRAFTPGRINYHFKFSGPSFSIDTACSSSFAAIHTACNSLWRGDCDTAIAGGTNVMTNPDNFAGLDRGHFLSPTGNCNTFDDNANGYCRADAVGTVILKRLEDAEADKDPVYGVILGAYTNHSAEADSMTRPHAGAQAFIFNKMLNQANLSPLDVSYIEMHGTGTQAGDATEMKSVLEVFAKTPRGADHPLHLGSAKANVGHAESASGVTSLIKVLKMMEKSEIPPHVGIKTKINHGFPTDLKERNVNIALKPTSWQRPTGGKRTVFLNNFSAAGGNTALLLEDASVVEPAPASDARVSHLVAISAKTVSSLEKNVKSLIAHIENTPELSLPAISYTTTARRMHHDHRVIVHGGKLSDIKDALANFGDCTSVKRVLAKQIPNIAFAYTGQGTLYIGMAREFYETMSQFRSEIQRFNRIGQSQGFPAFLPLVDGSLESVDALGPVASQLGATCVQMALTNLWISWGVVPSAVIGHSLGEYAALHAAGVISVSDAIYLAGTRAQLLVECCSVGTHSMLAAQASSASIKSHLDQSNCEIACVNAPENVVLSGKIEDITSLQTDLTSAGVKTVRLDVPFAFHSAQVEVILEKFETHAHEIIFQRPSVPFISPLLQEVVTEAGILGPEYLSRACRGTVNFMGGINAGVEAGVISEKSIWIEIGPHPICSGMIKSTIGSQVIAVPTLHKTSNSWKIINGSLAALHTAGIEVNWNEYHRDFNSSKQVLSLPAYNWDAKNYWIQYEHNWALTKGDKPALPAPALAPQAQPMMRMQKKSLSTAVQDVIEEDHDVHQSTITVESNLADPVLARSLQGHQVLSVALCPSSLWADMALTVGEYLLKSSPSKHDPSTAVDVSDMKVGKTFIQNSSSSQLVRVAATADWAKQAAQVEIFSVNDQGKKTVEHATCILRFGDSKEWAKDWKRSAYLIQSRIDALRHGIDDGSSQKLNRATLYKLFGAVVEYGKPYQGIREIIIDSDMLEATAQVKFQATSQDGDFNIGPYRIDSLGHIAGFIMNANENNDSKQTVYINHGWDRLRCVDHFDVTKSYQTYNKMQNVGGTNYSGDTYILEDGNIVAVFEGVKFQGLPRSAIEMGLGVPRSGKVAPRAIPAAQSITMKIAKATAPAPAFFAPKQVQSAPNVSIRQQPSIIDRALAIVAEEAGIERSDLTPGAAFADFGIDSLLSLNITSRFLEELEIEVDSSLFATCPNVKDLVAFLPAGKDAPADTPSSASTSAISTPTLDHLSVAGDESDFSLSDPNEDTSDAGILATIRLTIAEEVGIPIEELTSTLAFSDVGFDSLLSLTVLGKLREVLDVEIPSSLFSDTNSLKEVEAALGLQSSPKDIIVRPAVSSHPPATSILLQGNPKTASKLLFLFPDGSGSATSYAPLPKLSSHIAVYGLNCPYMKTPELMTCSLEELTPSYLAEVRRRQPHGPYNFGGWSAGGVCAFDAAQQLDREGEEVDHLILIDSPFPIGLEKLPPRLYDFFNSIGLFGTDKTPPSWLLPHFLSFIESLDQYRAVPFPQGSKAPKTHIIWAKDGVCKTPEDPRPPMRDDDPKEMKWLLNNRTDFTANGWDKLIGKGKVVVQTMSDANHFTMMEGEKAQELAAWVKNALA